jgi:hypothetical protein
MNDAILIGLVGVFGVLSWGLISLCEWVRGGGQ